MAEFRPQEYWEKRLRDNFGLQGVGYLGMGRRYNEWLYRLRRRAFLTRVPRAMPQPKGATVLDVGSGTGYFIEAWQKLGAGNVMGCDLTETAVERLQRRYPQYRFLKLDIGGDTAALAGARFDAISAIDVLYHIVDDDAFVRALQNIYSLLKPGGVFVFTEIFLHGEPIRSAHQAARSIGFIEGALRDEGFRILERVPIFHFMASPIDSRSRARWGLWRVLSRVVPSSEAVGFLLGAALYPVDAITAQRLSEGPSTEMMLVQKPWSQGPGL